MQGQRRTLDSFPETFGVDLGSSTSDTGIDQQMFWNDILNPIESGFPGCLLPPGETNSTNANAVSCDRRSVSLSGWNLGESSSGESTRNQMIYDGPKREHGWSSSLSNHAGSEPRLEERPSEATNTLFPRRINIDLNSNQEANISLFSQTSGSNEIRHNLNLNTEYTSDSGNDGHFIESGNSHPYKPSGSESAQINSTGGSATPFGAVSGSGGYLTDETDGRPGCSSDGRRLSCKRKTLEGGVSGQSSLGGSSSYFPRTEDSVWHAFPARYNAASSSSTPSLTENSLAPNLLEQLNPSSGIVFRGVAGVASDRHPAVNGAGHAESSQRNVRMRINPSQPLGLAPSSLLLTENPVRLTPVWTPHQLSSRHIPFSHPLDSRPTSANTSFQMQSHITHIHGFPQNIPPFQYNGAPNSSGGTSSSSVLPGERPVVREEIQHSRSLPRNISEHPMFVPASDMRSSAHNPTDWSVVNGNTSNPRNFVSASRVGPSSGDYPSQSPAWVPPPIVATQYSRRLSEVVRQSLYPSTGSESRAQTSNFPPSHPSPSAPSQEMVLSSASGSHGNHQPHPRPAVLMDRQGDGVPLSFRSLPAASGRRSRLLSEIRNVLDIVRRGGGDGLRFEDVLILDQSVFFGVADLHDRHRDMRLDVDNMSYEELLALEERIGNVNTGLNEETISKRLKQRKYFTVRVNSASEIEPCCVCQEEYIDGEDLGTLNCGHDFHSECIKQWLTHKNICPICKTTALVT